MYDRVTEAITLKKQLKNCKAVKRYYYEIAGQARNEEIKEM